MEARHWSDEEIVACLYGVGPGDGHLLGCAECSKRLAMMRLRQEQYRVCLSAKTDDLLAAQLRSIFAGIEKRKRLLRMSFIPALATVLLVIVAVMINRPVSKPKPEPMVSDTQLFEDVFSIVTSAELRAVEPVRSLFEAKE